MGRWLGPLAVLGCVLAIDARAAVTRSLVEGFPVYVETGGSDRLTLRAHIRAGRSAAPASAPAVADLTVAWIVLGGSESMPAEHFLRARQELGMDLTGWVDRDLLTIEARAPRERLRPVIRLFADLLMYPAFASEVRPAAERDADRARRQELDPALEAIVRTLGLEGTGLLPPESPLSVPGYPSRAEAAAFHRERFGAESMVVLVSGPVTASDVESEMRDAFLGFRAALLPAAPAADHPARGGRFSLARREVRPGVSELIVAQVGLPRAHPDWLALELGLLAAMGDGTEARLAARLGTRLLASRLRIHQPLHGPDVLRLELEVPTGAVDALSAALHEELGGLALGRISPPALNGARRRLSALLLPPPETPQAGRKYALEEALGLPGATPAEQYAALTGIGRAQVIRALRLYVPAPVD